MDSEDRLDQNMNEFYDADTHVSTWADVYFNNKDGISEIDRGDIRTFFEYCGATDKIEPELREKFSAKHYGNKSRSEAMEAVWGGQI